MNYAEQESATILSEQRFAGCTHHKLNSLIELVSEQKLQQVRLTAYQMHKLGLVMFRIEKVYQSHCLLAQFFLQLNPSPDELGHVLLQGDAVAVELQQTVDSIGEMYR